MTEPADLERVASPTADQQVRSMLQEMEQLRADVMSDSAAVVGKWKPGLADESFHAAAANLAAYLTLRSRDLMKFMTSLGYEPRVLNCGEDQPSSMK